MQENPELSPRGRQFYITGGLLLTNRTNISRSLPALVVLVALLLLWEAVVRLTAVPAYILPAPTAILSALIENRSLLLMHTGVTCKAVAGGLSLALAAALFIALLIDRSHLIRQAFYPLLVISQAVPIFALAPLILIWFGAGLLPKVMIVALVCFFPLVINLAEGLSQVDPEALDLMQTMKANRWLTLTSLQIPATLPYFFSGLKIAVTYSVMGAIIGEWLAARAGLGIYMLRSMHSFQTSNLFAAILVVVLLSLSLFKLVELAGHLAMPWQKDINNGEKG